MHVVGTAGHVDHGKSSLVLALTGTNPDRWAEERLRGMTLDLGFAHLRFPDGVEAGIVDVPGHERFLHNMLAGAAGMELLLLVVAANEGVRPQTLEHLAILNFLNVRAALIVLTKSDLVDAAELEVARAGVREASAGSIADGAPVLAVSTVTGDGLDALRSAIHDALEGLPPRAPQAPPFLPVDRVFALPGHGTILTGTLAQGRLDVGDELQLDPPGRRVRVRNLHVFGVRRESVESGSRVAVNVPGVDTHEVARGAVLAGGKFGAAQTFDVQFTPVASALERLRRRTPVRAYLGSAEVLGMLVFSDLPQSVTGVAARLQLRRAVVTYPGEAFVVRALSPKALLGGGTLGRGTGLAIAGDDPDHAAVLAALAGAGLGGADAERLGSIANVRLDATEAILEDLLADGRAVRLQKPAAYADAALLEDFLGRATDAMRANQSKAPWALGVTPIALARALNVPEATAHRVLGAFADEGRVAHRNGYYATPDFTPALNAEQRAFFDRTLKPDPAQPNLPGSFAALVAELKRSNIAGLATAFDTLLAAGAIVKVDDAVYRGDQIAGVRRQLEATLRNERQITMARFRDLVGTSRKFAVPLLEYFDATGVTLRSGDVRVLRERR